MVFENLKNSKILKYGFHHSMAFSNNKNNSYYRTTDFALARLSNSDNHIYLGMYTTFLVTVSV